MKHLAELYEQALKDYDQELTKRQELEQQCKKQKEVIDKAIEFIDRWIDKWYANSMLDDKGYLCLLLDILKEGQNELI